MLTIGDPSAVATRVSGAAPARPGDLRGLFGLGPDARAYGLPPELAFLVAGGVATDLLRIAARAAASAGVTGEVALFARGFADERYMRLLALHLGVPYLERPLPLAPPVQAAGCIPSGHAPLAPNPLNLGSVMAPRGEALRDLLLRHADVPGPYTFALTTTRRFEALVRRHDAAGLCERSACGLAAWDATLSAQGGASFRQAATVAVTLLGSAALVALAPGVGWMLVALSLFVVFAAAVLHRLVVVAAGAVPAPAPAAARAPDVALPVYTVVVPLFREARMLEQVVRNLDALDYPRAKLDIKIMLEASDTATLAAATRLALPVPYDIVVLPDGHPRTKPRALNAALESARGEYLVVYDAEDRPDPGQLRAAAARFAGSPQRLACLQARLSIDHADEAWITRMFALDYAALFHAVKPGLTALGLPVPLGGTSNHFRTRILHRVGAWDAWNVTEDIDLGFRLARFGFAVGSLDSDTFEEAPLTVARWLPQRSRWLKGWMVTLVVHTRSPRRLLRDLGWRNAASVLVSLAGTVLGCLFGPPLLVLAAVEGASGALFRPETPLWWVMVAASATLLAAGAVAAAWPAWLGLRRLGRPDLAPWIATLPVYLLLVSLAAWRALIELRRDPHGWNKTEHGLAQGRSVARPAARLRNRGRPAR